MVHPSAPLAFDLAGRALRRIKDRTPDSVLQRLEEHG